MKMLPLLAIGATALAVAGFSSAASAHEHVSLSFFLGGPPEPVIVGPPPVIVEEHYYDPEEDYWADQRRAEHERWEAYHRWLAHEHCEHERWKHAHWHDEDDDDER